MARRRVPVDGAELHVVQEGKGVPVLVPTGGGIEFYRRTFSPQLLDALTLVYVEMRGTGESTGQILGATFGSLADDLEAVRASLAIEGAFVMGHSNHGCIALEYASRHPEGVLGVIPVASSPDLSRSLALGAKRFEAEASATQRAALARGQADAAAAAKRSLRPDELALRHVLAGAPLAWRKPGFDAAPLWRSAPIGFAAYVRSVVAASGANWSFAKRLRELRVPLFAISGRYDYLCPAEIWEDCIADAPDGTLAVLEESAHHPQLEERQTFDELVIRFVLDRASAARARTG